MSMALSDLPIILKRDCPATQIPSGTRITLTKGSSVLLTQSLGGNFTIASDEFGLARVGAADADALGFTVLTAGPESKASPSFSREAVMDKLRTIFDPEIPVNVVDLGLIYKCETYPIASGGHRVEIQMSMTAPGCGMGDVLKEDARAQIATIPGATDVEVQIVWDPPWDRSRMSEAARLQLGML
jgi:probable FeS assembly SUF system protein SufT